jgi:hypothetical protein
VIEYHFLDFFVGKFYSFHGERITAKYLDFLTFLLVAISGGGSAKSECHQLSDLVVGDRVDELLQFYLSS